MQCIGDYPCSEEEGGGAGVCPKWVIIRYNTTQRNIVLSDCCCESLHKIYVCMTYNVMHLDQSLARCLDLEIL